MSFTLGLLFVFATVAMLVIARPSGGIAAPYLKTWLAGQAYALTALASAVFGLTVIVTNWPF